MVGRLQTTCNVLLMLFASVSLVRTHLVCLDLVFSEPTQYCLMSGNAALDSINI